MNTVFETVNIENIFDDEPIFERQEFENLKTTQLMTCEEAEKIVANNLGIVHNLANRYA